MTVDPKDLVRRKDAAFGEVHFIVKKGRAALNDASLVSYFKGAMKMIDKHVSTHDELFDKLCSMGCEIEAAEGVKEKFPGRADKARKEALRDYWYESYGILDQIISKEKTALLPPPSASQTNSSVSDPFSSSSTSLPKLNLPKFSGNILEWRRFRDTYVSLVHDEHIPNIKKFHYLVSSLSGPAAAVISRFQIEEQNYPLAWQALLTAYDSKRMLASAYLNQILGFNPQHGKPSVESLNEFLLKISESVAAFKLLNIQDEAGFILFHLTIKCLDPHTREQFEISHPNNEFPKFDDLRDFVRQRSSALQLAGTNLLPQTPLQEKTFDKFDGNKRSNKRNSKPTLVTSASEAAQHFDSGSSSSPRCTICQEKRHSLQYCKKFQNSSVPERQKLILNWKGCKNCLSTNHFLKSCGSKYTCRWCKQKHHSSLCAPLNKADSFGAVPAEPNDLLPSNNAMASGAVCTTSTQQNTQVLLGTVMAEIQDARGKFQPIRIVLDSGSHYSFLTQRCLRKLGLKANECSNKISGIGQTPFEGAKGQVLCILRPRQPNSPTLSTSAIVVKEITTHLPTTPMPYSMWRKYLRFQLADPNFFEPSPIDFLLGADLFSEIWTGSSVMVAQDIPRLFPTIFGHVVTGKFCDPARKTPGSTLFVSPSTDNVLFDLQKFWEVEEPISRFQIPSNPAHDECEAHFVATHFRQEDGSFVLSLPFKNSPPELGDSYSLALRRFRNLETRLQNNATLREEYSKFMREYIDLGHMEPTDEPPQYVIPHHCIVKEDRNKQKIRVVFDGSAKAFLGSLNEHLMIGPKLQNDIWVILLNFRVHRFVFVADIVKMYRCIWIADSHRSYLNILWRFSPDEPLVVYRLKTVTYGLSCSPFQALRTLRQLSLDEGSNFPKAKEILNRDFFVDDVCSGAESEEAALDLQQQLIDLLEKGQFFLSKWASNSPRLLKNVSSPDSSPISFSTNNEDTSASLKILGLQWEPNEDYFTYRIHQTTDTILTKRGIFSTISKFYDPLGFLAPYLVLMKIFIQQLWKIGVDWDTSIPVELQTEWFSTIDEIHMLSEIRIPRFIGLCKPFTYQIIGFSDASTKAYCASVYVRVINGSVIRVQLLTAKTKVAPLQTKSVPRLELCGASLLSELFNSLSTFLSVMGEHRLPPIFFTDSSIVLSWLNTPPYELKTFVANRVVDITTSSPSASWRHVPSQDNPSDCGSRGLKPRELLNHQLWWYGPRWLSEPEEYWPSSSFTVPSELPELKGTSALITVNIGPNFDSTFLIDFIKRFSSLSKMLRVLARIRRLFHNGHRKNSQITGPLKTQEIDSSLEMCIKAVQFHEFFKDKITNSEDAMNRFSKLTPFFDSSGIFRAGGRLFNAAIPFNHKHPILLPTNSHLTNLVVDYYHKVYLHPGPSLLQALIQTKYWIPSLRRVTQKRTFLCLKCYTNKAKSSPPLMSDLPSFRVQRSRAFLRIGIDFAGPLPLRESSRRKAALGKAYLCLIVCATTKAVHLEPVTSLSADAFLAAFDRFTSRRGLPCEVHSDRGSNFVAAASRLKELWKWYQNDVTQQRIQDHVAHQGIKWIFNPPSAPHMGGLWEAGIKSAKQLLTKVSGDTPLTYEEMSTVFAKIEAILNSRPLCPLSSDPNECEYLSPGHFLIGDSLTATPEPSLLQEKLNRLDRWQLLKRMIEYFWTRWHREYLSTLLARSKWTKSTPNPKIGDLVLIKSDNAPVQQWPLARISALHPGNDGVVRIVTVRTPTSSYTRPVVKLVPLLPLSSDPYFSFKKFVIFFQIWRAVMFQQQVGIGEFRFKFRS